MLLVYVWNSQVLVVLFLGILLGGISSGVFSLLRPLGKIFILTMGLWL